MMMFELPDVRKPETGIRKYISKLDLRFPRIQEEKHFQSYYFHHIYRRQVRAAIIFLASVLTLALVVDYVRPLDLSTLPPYLPFRYFFGDEEDEDENSSSSYTITSSEWVPDYLDHTTSQFDTAQKNAFIIRLVTLGLLLASFTFTFTQIFKKLWKLYASIIAFIATCTTFIFIYDYRTIPERMILLYVIITIASGLTFLPATITCLALSVFYFLYYILYDKVYYITMCLVSAVIFVSMFFLIFISQYREQLIRDKFRTLEQLKLQTIRSGKVINQMLPTVVVQRLRLESSKEQTLDSIVAKNKEKKSTLPSASSDQQQQVEITISSDTQSSSSQSSYLNTAAAATATANNSNNNNATLSPDSTPIQERRQIDPQSPSSLNPGQYSGKLIVDSYDPVTVLFCEIVNFTALLEKMPAAQVVTLLNEVYNSFDRLTDVYGVTKVEHIGNVYMVVGGCPELCSDHAQRVAHMSLGMLQIIRRYGIVQVKIGMHTGPVVGGIIGKKKLSWHLFGDTINTSSRMASHSSIDRIQVSAPVQQLLRAQFLFEDRGKIQVKGKGMMRTFYLIKTKSLDKRYTSIFTSSHRDKPYIPPIDISEVVLETSPQMATVGGLPSTPTFSSTLTNVNSVLDPPLSARGRKGSIFASVVPPKVLSFLQQDSSSSSEPQSHKKLEKGSSTSNISNLVNGPNTPTPGSSTTTTTTTTTSNYDSISKKKSHVTFVQHERRGSRAPSIVDDMDMGESSSPTDIEMNNMDTGKGVKGSNIINSNSTTLSLIENDLKKHYTLEYLRLKFISRDDLVEKEFISDYNKLVYKRILLSMIFATIMMALGAIADYFFLKEFHDDEYDLITGLRFGIAIFGLIYIYICSKATRLRMYLQILGTFYFIAMAISIIVLASISPMSNIPLEAVTLSSFMMLFTICYNFSGIRFWYANIVSVACIFIFNLSLAWKSTNKEIMLSHNFYLITVLILNISSAYTEELFLRQNWVHGKLLDKDRRETEQLVSEILPMYVVLQMKSGRQLIADEFEQVTIFLSDIVGFTEMAARLTPQELVETLNVIYSTFDELAQKHGVLKVATIGDAYLCVCGCPEKLDDHAERVASMAIEMLEAIKNIRTVDNIPIKMRIGLHTGPVVAGVVGIKMIHYQLWGESVQIAQQMENTGKADMIHVSQETYALLAHKYVFQDRGESVVKKRKIKTYFLERLRNEHDPPPVLPETSNRLSINRAQFGAALSTDKSQFNSSQASEGDGGSNLNLNNSNTIIEEADEDEERDEDYVDNDDVEDDDNNNNNNYYNSEDENDQPLSDPQTNDVFNIKSAI